MDLLEQVPTFDIPGMAFAVTVILLVIYALLVLCARYLWVIQPSVAKLCAKRNMLESQIELYRQSDEAEGVYRSMNLLLKKSEAFIPRYQTYCKVPIYKKFFGLSGDLAAGWNILHAIERNLLLDNEYAKDRARSLAIVALGRLQRTPDAPIKLRLELSKKIANEQTGYTDLRPLVQEAQSFLFQYDDEKFAILSDAKNKGILLLFFSMVSLLMLIYLMPGSTPIIVCGAIGGMLARLRTAVSHSTSAFDFGLSWSVLFLTPVVGALTGWFGILLVIALNKFGVTGTLLLGASLQLPNYLSLVLAFVFGWSATLFDNFISKLEQNFQEGDSEESQELETLAEISDSGQSTRDNSRGKRNGNGNGPLPDKKRKDAPAPTPPEE